MTQQMITKLNKHKIHLTESATWNIFWQIGIDIDMLQEKIDVTDYYCPEDVQQQLVDYLLTNYMKLTTYKRFGKPLPKYKLKKALSWERLNYFPSSIKKCDKDANK